MDNSEQNPGLAEALNMARTKCIEALSISQRDKEVQIAKAWLEYSTETNDIIANVYKVCVDSYKAYLDAFAKLPVQPDETATQSVWSAWADHIKACQQSPETAKAMVDAEYKLVSALIEAEKAYKDEAEKAYKDEAEKAYKESERTAVNV